MTHQEHFIQNIQPLLEKTEQGEVLTDKEEQIVLRYYLMGERLVDNSQN